MDRAANGAGGRTGTAARRTDAGTVTIAATTAATTAAITITITATIAAAVIATITVAV